MTGRGPVVRPGEERFWARVSKSDGCWLWTGSRNNHDYGYLSVGTLAGGDRRLVLAHRLSYELNVGPIPEGLQVCHHCDVPPCVRPEHLFVGTMSDNIRDAVRKGRMRVPGLQGSDHPMARLSSEQVLEIRARARLGERSADLGHAFGVTRYHINSIVGRRTWRHLPDISGPTPDPSPVPPTSGASSNAPTRGRSEPEGSHDRASRGGPASVEVQA